MPPAVPYPKVPAKAWASLRAKAVNAPSTKFTPASVAAMLDMSSPKSAGDNIVYPMRKLGLLDEDGALTQLGNKWRVNATYAEACQEILDAIYPGELAGFTNTQGEPDSAQVQTWMQHKGHGNSNARQMAATYVLIAQKKVPEIASSPPKKNSRSGAAGKPAPKPKQEKDNAPSVQSPSPVTSAPVADPGRPSTGGPNIHLDIQIHIPAEATAAQIDQIFASMGKHLYRS